MNNPILLTSPLSAPIDEISQLQISSRPARRQGGKKDLSSLRAIPGCSAGHKPFPPAFLVRCRHSFAGVCERSQEEHLKLLRYFYLKWPFFKW